MTTSSADQTLPAMPGTLPNGLDPFADESLPGFVMRMAENHGYSKPLDLLKALGPGFSTLRVAALRGTAHPGMADYLALRPDELDRLCYGQGPSCRVLGHELHDDLVVLGRRKFCPACIDEAPYHRAFWDLTLATVCPVHAMRLVDRCPHCKRTLNWNAGPLTSCSSPRCAGDLHWAEAIAVPQAELGGARGLHRLIHTGECAEFGMSVRALPVGEQIRLAFHLGCLARGREVMSRPTDFATLHPEEVHLVLDAGWRMCSDWPSAFHALLGIRRERASERGGRYGVRKHFGRLHAWLEKNGEPFARLLAAEFRSYILACPELATRVQEIRRARSGASLEHQFITMAAAREVLGVAFETMHALAIEHDLYLVPPSGSGAPALLRADLVHTLHQVRTRLLTKEDVRRMLGSCKRTVDKLREAGLLHAVPDPEDPNGILYPVESVEALLQELQGHVFPGGTKPRRHVTMAGLARRVHKPGFDVCDVVEAVRAGTIIPVAVASRARGLHRLLFRSSDVDRFVAAVTEVAGRTLTVVEAAAALGIKQEVAYHWVRTGLLATVTVDSLAETGRRVTEGTLEAFRREYMTGAEFAAKHRLSRKWAATHLVQAGVQPVSGPSVDGARQFLFRRADLEGLDVKKLVSGRSKLNPKAARARRLNRGGTEGFKYVVGRALKREFGEGLVRRYHSYRDEKTGTVIQVMTAGNYGVTGTYQFMFTPKHRDELGAAVHGCVAFAFADRPDYLLVPWGEVEPLLPVWREHETQKGAFWQLWIRADGDGKLTQFCMHSKPLHKPEVS